MCVLLVNIYLIKNAVALQYVFANITCVKYYIFFYNVGEQNACVNVNGARFVFSIGSIGMRKCPYHIYTVNLYVQFARKGCFHMAILGEHMLELNKK